ncbi:hypothetical protein ONZ45_g18137 [Pleurotus djamor]|nr:hypothetical protein ONZ45_g18137 [Pleurotus djamor]
MIIAEIIMVIRVWALWSRSRVIGIILFVASIVGAVVTAISFSRFDTHQSFLNVSEIAPQLSGCYPDPGNNAVFIGYLMLMAFEAVVMVLLLIKGVQDFRQVTLSGFLYTFYQDGIMYYALLLLISISNVVVLLSGPPEYANLLTTLQRTLHSLLSARVLLHLRISSAQRQRLFSPAMSFGAIGTLMFAEADPEHQIADVRETRDEEA